MQIIPLSIGEYKVYRFTTSELSHFLLQDTKATAVPIANYPTFYWRIERLKLYQMRIIPLSIGEYKDNRFTTCELSHFLLENSTCELTHILLENTKATAYHLRIIPLSVGEYKGYRFTNCELSHILLQNTKSTALPLAKYPTFYWRI